MTMIDEKLVKLIGPFPKKVKPEPIIVQSEDCGSYIREKVEYSVEQDERVKAYILIPKNASGQLPAIICHHQHAGNFEIGKSEVVGLAGDPDLAYAAELAEQGYITFAPDALGFEERNPGIFEMRHEYYQLVSRLVRGETLLAKCMHDLMAGVDYLQMRDEVDNNRIGFIGHSYGGRMALWLPAFDKRIRVSVSHCGCVGYKNSLDPSIGIQMAFCVPGIINWGDIGDIVRHIEPSSLLISACTEDKFSIGGQKLYNYAKECFKQGNIELKEYRNEHKFTKEMRQNAYEFIDKFL